MFPGHIFSTLPRTVRGAPTPLKGDPKGKNFLYTNGNSVIIRDIEVSRFPQAMRFIDNLPVITLFNITYMYAAALQSTSKSNGRQRFQKISLNGCSFHGYLSLKVYGTIQL